MHNIMHADLELLVYCMYMIPTHMQWPHIVNAIYYSKIRIFDFTLPQFARPLVMLNRIEPGTNSCAGMHIKE